MLAAPPSLQWDHPSMLLVVYDITNKTSFRNCTKWLERARAQKPEQPFPGVLLGNRKDLSTRREVSEREGQDLANENDLAFFECSAVSTMSLYIHVAVSKCSNRTHARTCYCSEQQ